MLIESRRQMLYASHHQFYVEDKDNPGDTGDPAFWTKEATADCLATIEGTVGVGTGTHGEVKVVTEIHDKEPPLKIEDWDHVTEAGLKVLSGRLHVIGCLDDKGEDFSVEPGTYRVRCCHANLAESDDCGEGGDWYLVQIWSSADASRRVLKQWSGADF
jgi:hypothetical protein